MKDIVFAIVLVAAGFFGGMKYALSSFSLFNSDGGHRCLNPWCECRECDCKFCLEQKFSDVKAVKEKEETIEK